MKSKNAKKGSKNDKVKRNVQTMKKAPGRQSKEEIITEEELENNHWRYSPLSHHTSENLYRWIFPPS